MRFSFIGCLVCDECSISDCFRFEASHWLLLRHAVQLQPYFRCWWRPSSACHAAESRGLRHVQIFPLDHGWLQWGRWSTRCARDRATCTRPPAGQTPGVHDAYQPRRPAALRSRSAVSVRSRQSLDLFLGTRFDETQRNGVRRPLQIVS